MKWVLYVWIMQGSAMGMTTHTGFTSEETCMKQADVIQEARLAREVRTICLPDFVHFKELAERSLIPQMERGLVMEMERLAK